MNNPRRGEIYWVNLDPTVGSEVKKIRPALIVSNNIANEFSSRVIVAPITSKIKKIYPFEVELVLENKNAKILLDQIRSIDKSRLGKKIAHCEFSILNEINNALKIVLDLP